MSELVYPREKTLGVVTLVLGLIGWFLLIVGTVGIALVFLLIGFLFYLFAQSAFVSYIKGNGVQLSERQFPDLNAQYEECCRKLGIKQRPKAYILNGNGGLNAFATKFLGHEYVVLMTDVVDAMSAHEDGVRFYIGHELGHIKRKHISGSLYRWPALWLPLIGAAYSRARETTCDRHGLACSSSPENGARALAALSAGVERWKSIDFNAYEEQAKYSSGFWMSLHELLAGYPWLTKRVLRVLDKEVPSRNIFSYLFAVFFPFAGRLGSGFGLLIMIYIIGILAAVAIPAYQDYTIRSEVISAYSLSTEMRDKLGAYYEQYETIPDTLELAGIDDYLSDGSELYLDTENMVLTVYVEHGELLLVPSIDDNGYVIWNCEDGEGIKVSHLPASCQEF